MAALDPGATAALESELGVGATPVEEQYLPMRARSCRGEQRALLVR